MQDPGTSYLHLQLFGESCSCKIPPRLAVRIISDVIVSKVLVVVTGSTCSISLWQEGGDQVRRRPHSNLEPRSDTPPGTRQLIPADSTVPITAIR